MTTEFIAYYAALRPQAIALITDGREITYAEFSRDVGKFVSAIREFGLPLGSFVAVACQNLYNHWLVLLALEHLGMATASFLFREGASAMSLLACMDLVISDQRIPGESLKIQHLISADWLQEIASHPAGEDYISPPAKRPDDPIRILRTSGTTGRPKMLVVSFSQMESRLQERMWRLGMSTGFRYLLRQHFTVNNNYGNATACIRSGGVVVSETRLTMAQTIKTYAISHASLLPIQLTDLMKKLPKDYSKPPNFSLSVYGGPISNALKAKAIARLASDIQLSYASNEAGLVAIIFSEGMGAIVPGVRVEVVDDYDAPLPMGCSGHIRVRTKGMANGYLGYPESTKRIFRDGWFYPGDMGILHGGNVLQIIGRVDDLLNIGGIKVAPHALEELISKNVKVKDVGICTTLTPDGIEGLCVAISTDEVLDMGLVEEIGRCFGNQCGKIRFMRVDSIPRTDTGKIQRALLKDAFASYRRAIEIKPDYADAHNNLGNTLRDLGRLVEAEASYRRALEIKPDYADAKYNKSLLLLLLGCFEEGWEKYEWRWRRKESPGMPDFGRPLWLGETSIQGKCVQLWGEQGVGDSIQFLRYTPRVANLAAEVFVRLPSTLTELVQRSFKSVKVLAERGLPVEFDYHCPLMSLALAFRTFSESDIPSDVPYLTPDPEKQSKWRKRLEKDDKLLVGIAWRGNPQHKNDRNRSIPFELLRGLLEIDQIRWVILQKPLENKEVLQLKQLAHCVMVSDELIDFDETAAATAELDLMISVDTAVAHHKRKSSSRRSMRKY